MKLYFFILKVPLVPRSILYMITRNKTQNFMYVFVVVESSNEQNWTYFGSYFAKNGLSSTNKQNSYGWCSSSGNFFLLLYNVYEIKCALIKMKNYYLLLMKKKKKKTYIRKCKWTEWKLWWTTWRKSQQNGIHQKVHDIISKLLCKLPFDNFYFEFFFSSKSS